MSKLMRTKASALIIRTLPKVSPSTDTGMRIIHGQVVEAIGETFNKTWTYALTPLGHGWASTQWLEAVPAATIPTPRWPRPPHGLNEINALFGDRCKALVTQGRVTLPAPLPFWDGVVKSSFACHPLLVPVFTSVFSEIHRRGLYGSLETFDGCYNCRKKRGATDKWSTHSWAIAVDINAATNRLNQVPQLNRRIVAIFEDHGFLWGGLWSRADGMHFQYCTGY